MQITGVSGATFQALREKLLSTHQTDVTGTTDGVITGHGITANYHYESANQTLSVDVKQHPFYLPVSAIEHHLRETVLNCS